jgi:hypothetical protein
MGLLYMELWVILEWEPILEKEELLEGFPRCMDFKSIGDGECSELILVDI